MKALSELDAEWNPELARSWDGVLQSTIDHIAGGYEVS